MFKKHSKIKKPGKLPKVFNNKFGQDHFNGLLRNPVFYFGLIAVFLFFGMYGAADKVASSNGLNNSRIVFFNSFFNNSKSAEKGLFFNQTDATPLLTPDLKIMQDNALFGISTPQIVTGKVLGDVLGGNGQNNKDIVEYVVQPGDTLQSISEAYKISVNTLAWANDLTSSSALKTGQTIVILPADGVLHVVKSGDTISAIAQKYKAESAGIISYNELANQDDIYVGDVVIIPGGTMPKKSAPIINNNQIPLADNFFIYPAQGRITQGLHYYNAVDVANKCGSPVYAAAAGTVQRVKYGYNFGGGNLTTILHSNGVVTYYGHLMTIFVKPGDKVNVGDRIALIGGDTGTAGDGISTGCHVHFQVMGAKNPLSVYKVGTNISYK